MKKGAIIIHPLPRVGEIAQEVDDSPHAVYFKQVDTDTRCAWRFEDDFEWQESNSSADSGQEKKVVYISTWQKICRNRR